MTYFIHEDNMERLTKKLTTIRNKCSKFGCEFRYQELGEVFKEVTDEETGYKHTARFIEIETEGVAKLNDWEFIATIEHNDPINIIRSFNTEVEIPVRYFTAKPYCEHCKTTRTRKDTYLVRNTITGEFKQVGNSCLKDFTSGMSASMVASYISWFDEMIKGEAPSAGYKLFFETKLVLMTAVEAVRNYGYVKATQDEGDYRESTKSIVIEQLPPAITKSAEERIRKGFDVNHEGNLEKAEAILAWVNTLEEDYGYKTNLKACCRKEYCETRDIGIIASAVAAYNREIEKQERKAAEAKKNACSNFVGEIGKRVDLSNLTVKLLTSWETMYGYTYMYKFTDNNGNIFTWKTGTWIDTESVSSVNLKATIKAHSEYRGVKQTELTRCKIL